MAQTDSLYSTTTIRDAVPYSPADTTVAPLRHQSKLKQYYNNLIHGNVDHTRDRKMDVTFAIVPTYSREGGVGIGGAVTTLYRLDRQDTIMQPSDLQLSGSVAVKGLYAVALQGRNYFKGNRSSLTYVLKASRKTLNFWGISYNQCDANPQSQYVRNIIRFDGVYTYNILKNLQASVGPLVNFTAVSRISNPEYLDGQRKRYFFSGASMALQYDTRDFKLNPKRGIYAMVKEAVYPSFMGSTDKTVATTTMQFNAYHKLWKNAILGYDAYTVLASGSLPWPLRQEFGEGACRMRGYYSGRYIDNNILTTQIELRQHIKGRFGCAAWVGAGTVFPSISQFSTSNILPNCGLGLRVEVKHNVNLRIDYGFGRNTSGLVIEVAEAF